MITQRSPEWFALRLGKVTASRISEVVAKTKTGWSAIRDDYMIELITEKLTGVPAEHYINNDMQFGIDHEIEARTAYEFYFDSEVVDIGFVPHAAIANSGASPDGLVGDDGLVEFKCPKPTTHVKALLSGSVPTKYILQMQWQLACTDRRWCDYASYDPRTIEPMRLWVKRFPRDDEVIRALERDVIEFLLDLNAKLSALTATYGHREAA